jgi:hypothetical protein
VANPRAVVDTEGIGSRRITQIADGSIVFNAALANGSAQAGLAVQQTGNNTVGLTLDATEVIGRLERVHPDGMCVVQVEGGCMLPGGNAATLTAGSQIVGALLPAGQGGGGGGIRAAVVAESHNARGRIVNAAVTTAVQVMLD